MPNPFYNRFNGGNQSGPMSLIQRFKEFKANFQGDPQQQVQNLLNSGQMTQEQFNNLSNMATQFKEMFKQ